jgi:ketosteroid isomerase-like protein
MSGPTSIASEAAVLRANATFYRAFTMGDFAAMSTLWAEEAHVTCFHPGSALIRGRAPVLSAWRQILAEPAQLQMRCDHAHVQLLQGAAIVTCYEGNGEQPAHLAATNVFVFEQERWRMVHHQAGPLQRPIPRQSTPSSTGLN